MQFAQPSQTGNEPEKIETKRAVLSGPTVVNKIDLSQFNTPKPADKPADNKSGNNADNKRKRIQAKPNERFKPTYGNQGGGSGNRPGGGGGNNRPGGGPNDRNRNNNNNRRGEAAPPPTEQEIQEQIRKTLAELRAGSQKSNKSKYRREKRQAHADEAAESNANQDNSLLHVTEFISVSELASLMNKSAIDIIRACMSLGIIVSINQRLDAEIIEVVAGEFGFKATFVKADEDLIEEEEVDAPEDLLRLYPS
jgi:translation initiation factor IF-2